MSRPDPAPLFSRAGSGERRKSGIVQGRGDLFRNLSRNGEGHARSFCFKSGGPQQLDPGHIHIGHLVQLHPDFEPGGERRKQALLQIRRGGDAGLPIEANNVRGFSLIPGRWQTGLLCRCAASAGTELAGCDAIRVEVPGRISWSLLRNCLAASAEPSTASGPGSWHSSHGAAPSRHGQRGAATPAWLAWRRSADAGGSCLSSHATSSRAPCRLSNSGGSLRPSAYSL